MLRLGQTLVQTSLVSIQEERLRFKALAKGELLASEVILSLVLVMVRPFLCVACHNTLCFSEAGLEASIFAVGRLGALNLSK